MDAEKLEKEISKQGIDPEKLEEKFSPGLHEKMEMYMEHHHGKKGRHTHTVVHHHKDKSHTSDKHYEDGSVDSSAHANLDGVHDMLQDAHGEPNPGEAEANMGQHGVPPAQAGPVGLPVAAAPAGM